MSGRAKFVEGAKVRVRDKVPYYRGSEGEIVNVDRRPCSGRQVIVDIPGDGPTYFAVHELELLPDGGEQS